MKIQERSLETLDLESLFVAFILSQNSIKLWFCTHVYNKHSFEMFICVCFFNFSFLSDQNSGLPGHMLFQKEKNYLQPCVNEE